MPNKSWDSPEGVVRLPVTALVPVHLIDSLNRLCSQAAVTRNMVVEMAVYRYLAESMPEPSHIEGPVRPLIVPRAVGFGERRWLDVSIEP